MKPTISLGIDNPCSESWDQMSPDAQGRFCGSCQKTVVDFSAMTDQELLQWFAFQRGSVCGRLRQDQLHRPLLAPVPRKKITWRYWHYLIAGLLFSSEAPAQGQRENTSMVQQIPIPPEISHLMGDTIIPEKKPVPETLRGRVVDSSGQPVMYASVMYSLQKGTVTDEQGYFTILTGKLSGNDSLSVTAVGYQATRITVDRLLASHQVCLINLKDVYLGGVIAVSIVRKKKKTVADTVAVVKDALASIHLTKPALTVYPNPVSRGGSINISARLDQPGTYGIQLFNSAGLLVESRQIDRSANPGSIAVPISANLVPGAYFVRLSHPSLAKSYTQEIVVY